MNSVDQALVNAVRRRYLRTLERIAQAAQSVGRDPATVRLVVVTKTHPLESVRAALEAGARDLGENYAEEGAAKVEAIGPVDGLRWHMIGHVQSRKASLAASHFDFVHALDSLKLAARLDRFAGETGRRLPVLLEVNVSGEGSKFGYAAWDNWDALRPEFEQIAALPNLEIRGLMTMPPFADDPEASRPFFRRMRALQAFLGKNLPQAAWRDLSMGTSLDFSAAVEEGATLVRVGTAILGSRNIKR
ncbi:MAG: YggS family pyridoxal phosphate-dependent enzyme [Anaerolineales bacterium]